MKTRKLCLCATSDTSDEGLALIKEHLIKENYTPETAKIIRNEHMIWAEKRAYKLK